MASDWTAQRNDERDPIPPPMTIADAIAVFDKSAIRTRPNVQTAAWCVIRAELMLAAAPSPPAAANGGGDAEDAARYRWLRKRWGRIDEHYAEDPEAQIVWIGDGPGWDVDPESLDAAIDAALTGADRKGE